MAKRITIHKGVDRQEIWEDDFPNMERKGWSKEPPKPKSKKVVNKEINNQIEVVKLEINEVEENGNI